MNKIIIINQYGITPDLPGATKHYDMGKFFSNRHTHRLEFWMCGFNHHIAKNHKSVKGLKLQFAYMDDLLKIVRIKGVPYRNSSIMRQINHIVFDLITGLKILFSKNIDAVILSIPPITIFNVFAIKFKNIKLVLDVEDLWPLFLVELGLRNKAAIHYFQICSNYTYNVSDAIVPVSGGMLDYVKGIIRRPINMWLAPLGVNYDLYNSVEYDMKLIENKTWKNDYIIMYLGAHGLANDIYSVLDTINRFNEINKTIKNQKISFVFIGDGDQRENLIKYASKYNIQNVYFEGPVPSNMVPKYLILADICLTNLKKIESFKLVRPNKLFQYMALGKPVICGIWGEAADIVVKVAKAGIYVDFNNPISSAQAMLDLINDSNRLKTCANNGKEYVLKFGDRSKIFEDYFRNVRKIINS